MIYKNQTDRKRYRNSIFFTSSARVGFRHLLNNLNIGKDGYILLPSYIGYSIREGSGVIDPIEECGITYAFYRVKRNLSVDLDDLQNKIKIYRHKTFAVFVIHYFGFLQSDIIEIRNICANYGIYLVEDCAHCFKSSYKGVLLGDFGDFSLFSIHKILPTLDGGILKVNRNDVSLPLITEDDKISFESLESYLTSNMEEIAKIRINNYKFLLELLLPMRDIEILYPQLEYGIVPMNFPILIKSKSRHDVYQGLIREGVETMALYYQLIDSIQEEVYPLSHEISHKILNLPIHQDVNEDDLHVIADKLYKVLR